MGRHPITFFLVLFLVVSASTANAASSSKKPKPKKKSLAELVFERAPDLRGIRNPDAPEETPLGQENKWADEHHLARIENKKELSTLIESNFLIGVPEKARNFYVDRRLNQELRYIAPDALDYMRDLGAAYSEEFGAVKKPKLLRITSLVRTEEYQRKLVRHNPNAAKCDIPERCTVHTTGYALDFSTKGWTPTEILWFADYLESDIRNGKILAIYEYKRQHNFHIFVLPITIPGDPQ